MAAAFALNFLWEMIQAPLFIEMRSLPPWEATKRCLLATVGDAVIVLVAYVVTAACLRDPCFLQGRRAGTVFFFGLAFAISMALELHALQTGRWHYDQQMPIVPWLDVGLSPVAQWVVIPLLLVGMTRHSFTSRAAPPR